MTIWATLLLGDQIRGDCLLVWGGGGGRARKFPWKRHGMFHIQGLDDDWLDCFVFCVPHAEGVIERCALGV